MTSDRNAKENFAQWNYKADAGTVHIGPMAQDFHADFGVGPDDRHVATLDTECENAELTKQNEEILQRLRALEAK